jgi:ATP-dependent DNA ligase
MSIRQSAGARKAVGGEGLTAADMKKCICLKPKLVAAVEYAEWTPANHLRHTKFMASGRQRSETGGREWPAR